MPLRQPLALAPSLSQLPRVRVLLGGGEFLEAPTEGRAVPAAGPSAPGRCSLPGPQCGGLHAARRPPGAAGRVPGWSSRVLAARALPAPRGGLPTWGAF